jgi:N-acetylmuramoyl-L-alanine amidase
MNAPRLNSPKSDERGWEQNWRFLNCLRLSACICGSFLLLVGCRPDKKPVVQPTTRATTPATTRAAAPMSMDEAIRLIDRRAQWTDFPPIDVPRNPAEKYLNNLTIVIDPGHGGEDGGATSTKPAGYKAGPTGEREAYMNLRVALLLQKLLKDAGVNVIMTREGDDTIGLTERAEVANHAKRIDGGIGADLFVSIHHNAGGGPTTNYTSVWYHGTVDDNEPDLDVARYLALELGKAMRTQVARSSPIFSSQLMYDGGFGVLRTCKVPGVLCECSFYTDPTEEQRLRDAGYNLREAYAIYNGLCAWAYCGRPTQSTPTVELADGSLRIMTTLSEGLPNWWGSDRSRILRSSIFATIDGKPAAIDFDPLTCRLIINAPAAFGTGEHVLTIHHANLMKNHNWPQRYGLKPVSEPGAVATTGAASRPAGSGWSAVPLQSLRPSQQPATRPTLQR